MTITDHSTDLDTPAYEIVQMHIPEEPGGDRQTIGVTIRCSVCSHIAFTAAPKHITAVKESWIQDHLDQHAPGRATDIEVNWDVLAWCSVCPDGVGDIEVVDSEALECQQCHTTWSMNGTGGEVHQEDDQ